MNQSRKGMGLDNDPGRAVAAVQDLFERGAMAVRQGEVGADQHNLVLNLFLDPCRRQHTERACRILNEGIILRRRASAPDDLHKLVGRLYADITGKLASKARDRFAVRPF